MPERRSDNDVVTALDELLRGRLDLAGNFRHLFHERNFHTDRALDFWTRLVKSLGPTAVILLIKIEKCDLCWSRKREAGGVGGHRAARNRRATRYAFGPILSLQYLLHDLDSPVDPKTQGDDIVPRTNSFKARTK